MNKRQVMVLINAHGGLRDIKDTMWDWYGIKLTKQQAVNILNQCIKGGSYLDCGFDTCCREYAAHLIGHEITGMEWPLGEDTEEYSREFFAKLLKGSEAKGYNIKASRYAEYFASKDHLVPRMKLRFGDESN